MSQAHVDALLVARDKLKNPHRYDAASQFVCGCLPLTIAAYEIRAAIQLSLGRESTLNGWLYTRHGIRSWGDEESGKMLETRLAWIDQMLLDWKDAP